MRTGDEAISIDDEGIPHFFDTNTKFIDSPTEQPKGTKSIGVGRGLDLHLIGD
jgi:hypothetical protein